MRARPNRRAIMTGALALTATASPACAAQPRRQDVDIRRFGARGDGRSDDTPALAAALAAVQAGQRLYIPPGVYLISNVTKGPDWWSVRELPVGADLHMADGAWLKRHPDSGSVQAFIRPAGDNVVHVNIDGGEFPVQGSPAGDWPQSQSFGVTGVTGARNVRVSGHLRNLSMGVLSVGARDWIIENAVIERTRGSGVQLAGGAGAPCLNNIVRDCRFREHGDTAVAFWQLDDEGMIVGNRVERCDAVNTQYLANGYAFDVEAAAGPGKVRDNVFLDCAVRQTAQSVHSQGGFTMGDFSEGGRIENCRAVGNMNSNADVAFNIPGSSAMRIANVTAQDFRGGAIRCDGASDFVIDGAEITDCGGESVNVSAINVAMFQGATRGVVRNVTARWRETYPYLNQGTAVVAVGTPETGGQVSDITIENVTADNPIDVGVYAWGVAGRPIRNLVIRNLKLAGGSSGFSRWPVHAVHVDGLEISGMEVTGARRGMDLQNSRRVRVARNRITLRDAAPVLDLAGASDIVIEDNAFDAPGGPAIRGRARTLSIRGNRGLAATGGC